MYRQFYIVKYVFSGRIGMAGRASDEMLALLSVWGEVQMTCYGPADASTTPSSVLQKYP